MTADNLKIPLQKFLDESTQLGASLYFLLKPMTGSLDLKRANLNEEDEAHLKRQFLKAIKTTIVDNQEILVVHLSTASNTAHTIFKYDYCEKPPEFQIIESISNINQIPHFNFKENSLNQIKGFLLCISNDERKVLIYKHNYPVNLFKSNKRLSIIPTEQRFEIVNKDVLHLDINIDLFYIDNYFYILSLNVIEKFFNFHEIIKREADQRVIRINNIGLIDNMEKLQNLQDLNLIRKLAKISLDSPILQGQISNESIIESIEKCLVLKGKFKFNDDKSKIKLKSKAATDLFLKILNDDILHSEITQSYYDSSAKSSINLNTEVNSVQHEHLAVSLL